MLEQIAIWLLTSSNSPFKLRDTDAFKLNITKMFLEYYVPMNHYRFMDQTVNVSNFYIKMVKCYSKTF